MLRAKAKSSLAVDGAGIAGEAAAAAAGQHARSAALDPGATKLVGAWISGVAGSVFGMVTLGGLTRLTRSGLSMTEWRPQGSRLPNTAERWEAEFEKYKRFPEYAKLNRNMTMDEFKRIYFMEWFHRMWGRSIGLAFALPFAGLLAHPRTRAAMTRLNLYPRLALLFSMGGAQGLVGWWMVKSGLTHEHVLGFERSEHDTPRVSPYRLAAHLSVAFATYGLLTWTALTVISESSAGAVASLAKATAQGAVPRVPAALSRFRSLAGAGSALLGVTIVSGAFVAGNDAGRAYNDWPMYAGRWIPAGIKDDWEEFKPAIRNVFENTALVQFDHRMLAYASVATAVGIAAVARGSAVRPLLAATSAARSLGKSNSNAALAALGSSWPCAFHRSQLLLIAVAWQGCLGVATLMHYVPVSLGVLHQASALVAWTASLALLHSVTGPRIARALLAASKVEASKKAALATVSRMVAQAK